MPYYAIPEDVLADDGRLLEWADASARLAKTARSLKKIDHA
jgi:TfoX/Sxy family transcriptional regulator of competence genes